MQLAGNQSRKCGKNQKFVVLILSRDVSNSLQDGLETLDLSGFEELLLPSQKSRYSKRKIKHFEIILQVFGHISAQYQPQPPANTLP